MAKEYELGLVLRPDLDEERQQNVLARYRQVIETHGGSLEEPNVWGKRRLAYEIKDQSEGIYIFLLYTADASANAELDRLLRIDDNVLRFMAVVRPRPNPPKPTTLPEAGPGAHAEGSRGPTSGGDRPGPGLPEPRKRPTAQGVNSMPTPAPTSDAASNETPATPEAPTEPAAESAAAPVVESAAVPTPEAPAEAPALVAEPVAAPDESTETPAADDEPSQD